MRFTTAAWLIVLFVTVVSGNLTSSSEDSEAKSDAKFEGSTESSSTKSTAEKSALSGDDKLKDAKTGEEGDGDDTILAPDKDMTDDKKLFLFKAAIDEEDKIINERNQKNSLSDTIKNIDQAGDININSENPTESKISKDFIDVPRQESNSEVKLENPNPGIQFDDSKTEVANDPSQKFGGRSRNFKQRIQDSMPFLQLTQGGYERPFKRLRIKDRYSTRPDSSEQSEKVQKPDTPYNNRISDTRRVVPQVSYSSSLQPPYTLGQGQLINPTFDASARNVLSMNQILPPPTQSEFLNHPPTEFASYSTTPFQSQFSSSNDIGSFPNFNRDLNNVGMYQTLTSNPFQTPGILFQNSPQVQAQPVLVDNGRNIQSQFQQNLLASYPGYQTIDSSSPNYAMLFRNPAINNQFQVPSNFYGNAPNPVNALNSPEISFLSQYPNFASGVPSQFLQYPNTIGTQNNQQSSSNQQFETDVSQDDDRAKVSEQKADKRINRDDVLQTQFGAENIADVYMRYPTVEAGYAIEENLPMQNNSDESSDESKQKQTKDRETNVLSADPYKNILNSARNNQRINNSYDFPPEFFRSVPIDFGYQRSQDGIPIQYPDRNRGVPSYLSPNFQSRIPFRTIASLPESFISVNNQKHVYQESNETPACAKENNASVCFEDSEYPKNDIFYALNSNSFVSERLSSPESSLESFAFVERSANETEPSEENYACDVATKYGMPLRAKNLDGIWKIIVNLQERFSQPVRMEVCKTLGSPCSYADSRIKTECVQKYSLQRLLTWSPGRGVYSEIYKIPVACSCQITQTVDA